MQWEFAAWAILSERCSRLFAWRASVCQIVKFAEVEILLQIHQRMKIASPHTPLEVPPTLSECLLQDALSDMLPLG